MLQYRHYHICNFQYIHLVALELRGHGEHWRGGGLCRLGVSAVRRLRICMYVCMSTHNVPLVNVKQQRFSNCTVSFCSVVSMHSLSSTPPSLTVYLHVMCALIWPPRDGPNYTCGCATSTVSHLGWSITLSQY